MRSLALAQAWADDGGKVAFLTTTREERLLRRLRNEQFQVRRIPAAYPAHDDWEATRKTLGQWPGSWLVLDGYAFDEAYHRHLLGTGHPVLAIDDNAHLDSYDVDIVVNQNLHAKSLQYRVRSDTRLLLGPAYVLLRRDFRRHGRPRPPPPAIARRVLVTLGGADPLNVTQKIVEGLRRTSVMGLEAEVILGPNNRNHEELARIAAEGPVRIRLRRDVSDMVQVMAKAELAVSAGGTTSWELAYMGVPTLAVILADNQRNLVNGLEHESILKSMGWHEDLTPEDIARAVDELAKDESRRNQMIERGQALVDGRGVERVVAALHSGPRR